MSSTDRIYKINDLLQNRRHVKRSELLDALGVSRAQFNRDLEYMRYRLNAPIKFSREYDAYYLDKDDPDFDRYHLPGLWLSADEIFALLTLQGYIDDIFPDLLGKHTKPLAERIGKLLSGKEFDQKDVQKKIRIIHIGSRARPVSTFQTVAYGLVTGVRLKIDYFKRSKNSSRRREISPQRLVHYRENWYLDAWCHASKDLRIFSVDSIESVELSTKRARKVADRKIDKRVTGGYGIFSGEELKTAVLRFNEFRTRWVKFEEWHPDQERQIEADGGMILRIPYSEPHELVMDVLRYGPDVEVLAPDDLREHVSARINAANSLYRKAK